MRLVLVNPWEEKSSHPNLGLAYIASYLKKYGGFRDIHIIEHKKDLFQAIKQKQPDVVGFTAVTPIYSRVVELANRVKQELNCKILIGGQHINSFPHTLPFCFDVGIVGEGEQTILELMKSKFKNLENIKGIVYHEWTELKTTKPRELIDPLDQIPFPDRGMFDMEDYLKPSNILTTHEHLRGTNIVTSRGCPYRCIYCQSSKMWSKARFHSAEYVAKEIKMLYDKYQVEAIAIDDDLFVFKQDRIKELIKLLKKYKILGKIKFNCTARANLIDDEIMKLLKELGVVQVNLGFESGSQRMLDYLKNKTVTVQQNKNAIKLAHKYGMQVYGSFMLGNPTETKEEMIETLNFYKENPIETATLNITTPLPGTQLWDWAKERKIVDDNMDWSMFFNSLYRPESQLYINEIVPHKEFMQVYKQFQYEIFQNTVLKWKGLSFKEKLIKASKHPGKSLKFALKNITKLPHLIKNGN